MRFRSGLLRISFLRDNSQSIIRARNVLSARNRYENYLNTYENAYPVLVCAYFDRNICMNLGDGSDQEAFMQFRLADEKTSTETMKKWAAK